LPPARGWHCLLPPQSRPTTPAPKEADFVAREFRFHTGEVMPELRLHYTTIGAPSGEPVLILHGTTGSGASMLTPAFAGELFGPGQPLDASKYTSSSCRMRSARENPRSRPTDCAPSSRNMTTTTWSPPNTGW
jgi:hypothetical protein